MKCFISGCESDFHARKYLHPWNNLQTDFSTHRFPINAKRRLQWIQKICDAEKKDIIMETINFDVVRVCSKHFRNNDFYYENGRKRLKETAVPVYFENASVVERTTANPVVPDYRGGTRIRQQRFCSDTTLMQCESKDDRSEYRSSHPSLCVDTVPVLGSDARSTIWNIPSRKRSSANSDTHQSSRDDTACVPEYDMCSSPALKRMRLIRNTGNQQSLRKETVPVNCDGTDGRRRMIGLPVSYCLDDTPSSNQSHCENRSNQGGFETVPVHCEGSGVTSTISYLPTQKHSSANPYSQQSSSDDSDDHMLSSPAFKRIRLMRNADNQQSSSDAIAVAPSSGPPEGPPVLKRKRPIRYAGDLKGRDVTAEEALLALPKVQAQLERSQKTVKLLRGQNKRLRDRLESMQQLLNKLQKKKMLTDASHAALQDFSSSSTLLHELKTRVKEERCSEILRAFATTLHFYSPKAYDYVRKTFNNTLPCPRTLVRWYERVGGEPGITQESLDKLKVKVAEQKRKGKPLLVALLMDEMAIRQQIMWNPHTHTLEGAIDQSSRKTKKQGQSANDEAYAAKEVLLFMVSGVQDSFTIPVAYFLSNGINAEEKSEVVKTVLISLEDAGVTTMSLTFDGTVTNFATANRLGCYIHGNGEPLKTSFKHPVGNHDVHVLLDSVHMIKLVRNTLHKLKVLMSPNGAVEWKYIEKLNELQNIHKVKLAKNLTDNHVYFEKSKMKVRLAVQVISNSVAEALEKQQPTKQFRNCGATIEFLSLFNDLFDITNSMNENDPDFKKPLSTDNFDLYIKPLEYIEQYIKSLTLRDGQSLIESRWNTGFLGFLVDIKSFSNIFNTYVDGEQLLEKIFTYWFSQDHVERFFGIARSKSGSNNNPNAIQFKATYKRLLVNNELEGPLTGNCYNFRNVQMLQISDNAEQMRKAQRTPPTKTDPTSVDQQASESDTNVYCDEVDLDSSIISLAVDNCASEVQQKVTKQLKCPECSEIANKDDLHSIRSICKTVEYEFKAVVCDRDNVNIQKHYDKIVSRSLLRAKRDFENLFETFADHRAPADDHKANIVKQTIISYLDIKIKIYAKKMIKFKPTNRQKLTKLILFEGN